MSQKNIVTTVKMLVAGLILLSLLSSTAFSFVEICQIDNPKATQSNSEFNPSFDVMDIQHNHCEDSRSHCEAHCIHHVFSLSSDIFLIEVSFSEKIYPGYIFSFNQTYLESPFRPPLA